MTTIRVKENEPFDVALRRFKRTIEKIGLLTELRAREFYEKPTAERKRKKAAAVKRHFKRVRSMQLPKKLYSSVLAALNKPARDAAAGFFVSGDESHEPERPHHRRHEGRDARQGSRQAAAPSACCWRP